MIFAGLIGAIVWDLITWYYGLPTSSSHALIGGYAGAAVAKAGFGAIILVRLDQDAHLHRAGAAHRPGARVRADGGDHVDLPADVARRGSTSGSGGCSCVSAAAYSLGHGGNDAQKTMGIIAGVLVAGGYLQLVDGALPIPLWVVLAAHAAIALGTLSGGWRIIHTMGSKITKLQPVGGFAAETAGAISLFTATHLGIPVSTTHTITGAIIGVGSIKRLSAVRWGVAGRIVWAWILTIPPPPSSRRSPTGSSRRRSRRSAGYRRRQLEQFRSSCSLTLSSRDPLTAQPARQLDREDRAAAPAGWRR